MPMIIFHGVPNGTSQAVLVRLEEDVEDAVAEAMKMEGRLFHSYPHVSPTIRTRKRDMVYGHIATAFYHETRNEKETKEAAQRATKAAAETIWKILGCQFTVEIFPPPYMDQNLKTLIKAAA